MDAESVHSGTSHRSHNINKQHPQQHQQQQQLQHQINGNFNIQQPHPQLPQQQQQPHIMNNIQMIPTQPGVTGGYYYAPNYTPNNPYLYTSVTANAPSIAASPNNYYSMNNSNPNIGVYPPISAYQNNGYGAPSVPVDINDFNGATGEKIQVQILPQDDNWGTETGTAITSETGGSCEEVSGVPGDERGLGPHVISGVPNRCQCKRTMGNCLFVILCIIGVFSPVIMVVIPQIPAVSSSVGVARCGPACEGQLLGMVCKLIVLAVGTWALFFRSTDNFHGPRICVYRVCTLVLAIIVIFSFWVLFGLRIIRQESVDFLGIVQFASSLADSLLLVHYIAILLLEIRRLRTRFYIKIVRSPDGESRVFELGLVTIQQAAAVALQKYVSEFTDYNFELVQCLQKRYSKRHNRASNSKHKNVEKSNYKVYKVDKDIGDPEEEELTPTQVLTESQKDNRNGGKSNGSSGTSTRIYEENEWEKKFRKRQMRLLVAVEEALSHVKLTDEDVSNSLGSKEAAQTLLPAVMRPLHKLLKLSKRQLAFTSGTVTNILAQCLNYKLSPRYMVKQLSPTLTVLDSLRLANQDSVLHLSWTVVCQCILSRSVFDGLTFQLKPDNCKVDNLCLMCTIQSVPFFDITEQHFDPSQCRFVLQTNSETSV